MAEHSLGAGSSCALCFGEAEVRLRLGLEVKEIQPQQASSSQTWGGKGSRLQPMRTRGAQPALGFPHALGQKQRGGSARSLGAELPVEHCRCLWESRKPPQQSSARRCAPRSPHVCPEAPLVVSLPQAISEAWSSH